MKHHQPSPLAAFFAAFASLSLAIAAADSTQGRPKNISSADWSGIHAAYEAKRHAVITNDDGSLTARNPAQRWQIDFDGKGFTATPESADWSWGLELKSYGFNSAVTSIDAHKSSVSSSGGIVSYQWDGNLSEWFVNDSRGLEQGWNIEHRPEGTAGGPLRLQLAVRGGLVAQVSVAGSSISFLKSDSCNVLTYSALEAMDADGNPLPARFEAAGEGRVSVVVEEKDARYPITIDPLAQQAYLKASNTEQQDQFGLSVAISGNTAVVGAYGEDSGSNGVNGNQSSNTLASSGAAYVFVRNGSSWTQQAYLKASNTGVGDFFGYSVGISEGGAVIIVGAPNEGSGANGVNGNQNDNSQPTSGAAYIFTRDGNAWSQQAYIKASNSATGDFFGFSVAIDNNTAVVGAFGEDSNATGVNGNQSNNTVSFAGAAYIFQRNGKVWSQKAYLKGSTPGSDLFGSSVAVSEGLVVVGAPREDSNARGVNGNDNDNSSTDSGAAFVFRLDGNTWKPDAYLKASNTGALDSFGTSVSISKNTIVVGSPLEDSNSSGVNGDEDNNSSTNSGAAYVFIDTNSNWQQEAYVKASNSENNDNFGRSLAVSGNGLIVGAPYEGSNATGVNGDQENNLALLSGAAYLFKRSGDTWNQTAYLKASNTNNEDMFGYAVSVSGDVVVSGAPGEDSSATGVNNSQSSNSATSAGAAYLFLTLKQEIVVTDSSGQSLRDGRFTKGFGRVKVGRRSAPETFTIKNIGDIVLSDLSLEITGSGKNSFIVSELSKSQLAPGGSTTFKVTFKPTSKGAKKATIQIGSDDGDENPFDIRVSGVGLRR